MLNILRFKSHLFSKLKDKKEMTELTELYINNDDYFFKSMIIYKHLSLSFVGLNDAFNTIRLYKRLCQVCVQTAVLSGNYNTKYAALFRLLT